MSRAVSVSERGQVRTLACALVFVLACAAGYADRVKTHTTFAKQHPSVSNGSSTLVVTAAIAKRLARENVHSGMVAPEPVRTTIAWASPGVTRR
ncbi:MAG TPA: hypothetical protein VEC19_08470 [Usitatibacter sp.]|nr:hypothetical protein [Usitatibacter sp.]